MSIFYEPGTGIVPEEFFDDGGMVEIPHSVLWSSLDAETIAETYGVAAEDVLWARQELFAQGAEQQQPAGYWVDPGYAYPAPGYGYPQSPYPRPSASGTVTRPRPSRPAPRPRRPPARRPGRIVIRPRSKGGRVVVRDYRTKRSSRRTDNRRPSTPRPRGPFQTRPNRR